MGFIHDTKSAILSVEERSESVILGDTSDDKNHLFICYVNKVNVRTEIVQKIMDEAGRFYAKSEFGKAEEYRKIAEIIKHVALSPDESPHAFEASLQWLKELVAFLDTTDILKNNQSAPADEAGGEE